MSNPSDLPLVQWTLVFVQAATLGALMVYVWKTWQMAQATLSAAKASAGTLDEMRAARREASEPRPIIYFGTDNVHLAEIVIENAGQTTAADLSFAFDPALVTSERSVMATKFFETPKHLAPGTRLRHAFDSWPQYFGANLPLQYVVTLRYRRPGEVEYQTGTQILDAAGFQHYMQWGRKGLHEVAEELHKAGEATTRLGRDATTFRQRLAATEELMPTSFSLGDSVALLQVLWRAYKATEASVKVIEWVEPYLPVMRRATVTALMRLEAMPRRQELTEALLAVFLALHNHKWRTMGRTEAEAELDAALRALSSIVLPPDSAAP